MKEKNDREALGSHVVLDAQAHSAKFATLTIGTQRQPSQNQIILLTPYALNYFRSALT